MSILHTNPYPVSPIFRERATVDWPGYARACHEIAERHVDPVERAPNRKRAYALKYLGNKARVGDATYDKTEPRVFTPQFVLELAVANSVRRAKRNPQLEPVSGAMDGQGLGKLSADNVNILPFGPQITLCSTAAGDVRV